MMMMMSCFCGMVDQRKALHLIFSQAHCWRISQSQTFDMPRKIFFKIGVLKNFSIFTGKHLCCSFPVNIAKFLRTVFFIEHLRWLFLHAAGRFFPRIFLKETIRPVEEGECSFNYCKLRDSSYFRILRGSMVRINLVIRSEGGRSPFFGPKMSPKVPKLPKIYKSRTAGRGRLINPSK